MVVIIMQKFAIAVLLVAVVSAGGALKELTSEYKIGQPCANPVNAYAVSSFDCAPWPPTKGATIKSTSVGTFNQAEVITGINIDVLLSGKSFYKETIPQTGTYNKGDVGTFIYSQQVPSIAPRGSYTIEGGLVNNAKVQISCWEVAFTL